jgi:hypothetical protein
VDGHRTLAGKDLERQASDVGAQPRRAEAAIERHPAAGAVDDLSAGSCFDRSHHRADEVGGQPVVGIEEQQPAIVGGRDAAIARRRDPFAGPAVAQQTEALVAGDVALGELPRAVSRAVVDDDRAPITARLGQQTVERFGEGFRRVVRRNDNAEAHQMVSV